MFNIDLSRLNINQSLPYQRQINMLPQMQTIQSDAMDSDSIESSLFKVFTHFKIKKIKLNLF